MMADSRSDLSKNEVACAGVRGIQRMRRSQSAGSIGKTRNKVGAAKAYLDKHGFETETLAAKFLKCTVGSLGMDLMLPPLSSKVNDPKLAKCKAAFKVDEPVVRPRRVTPKATATPSPPKHVDDCPTCATVALDLTRTNSYTRLLQKFSPKRVAATNHEETHTPTPMIALDLTRTNSYMGLLQKFTQKKVGVTKIEGSPARSFYCKDVYSYEEFHNLVENLWAKFDDECLMRSFTPARTFYCKDVYSYEEFYNLVESSGGQLDDEHLDTMNTRLDLSSSSSTPVRSFYCKDVYSYEEFCNLVANIGDEFDDEYLDNMNTMRINNCQDRLFYCKAIQSYEEFHCMVGDAPEEFDDEVDEALVKSVKSFEECHNLLGDFAEEIDDVDEEEDAEVTYVRTMMMAVEAMVLA